MKHIKLQVTNKNIPRHQISLNKFNEIVEHSTIQNIKDTNTLLLETKKKLNYFKNYWGSNIMILEKNRDLIEV